VINCRKYFSKTFNPKVGKIVPGQNDIFAPVVLRVSAHFPSGPVESVPLFIIMHKAAN